MTTTTQTLRFSRNHEREVALLGCLYLEQHCDTLRAQIRDRNREWKEAVAKLTSNVSAIARDLVSLEELSSFAVLTKPSRKGQLQRQRAAYARVEAILSNCIRDYCVLLTTQTWSVFTTAINGNIETLIELLYEEGHRHVLDYAKYPIMCDVLNCDDEAECSDDGGEDDDGDEYDDEEDEEDDDEEDDDEEDDADTRADRPPRTRLPPNNSPEMLLLAIMNHQMQTRSQRDVQTNTKHGKKSQELVALLNERKASPTKTAGFPQFEKMSADEQQSILDTLKKVNSEKDALPLLLRLLQSKLPTAVVNDAMQRFENARNESESAKYTTWVNALLKLPFETFVQPANTTDLHASAEQSCAFFENAHKQLDAAVYGHAEAKNQLVKYIAQMTRHAMTNTSKSQSKGLVLGIQGPCGNGKTTLIEKGISKVLNLPFAAIPLGGATDSSFLNGHSYTYEGSVWGQIADVLMKTKCANPIIYMDELDKVSDTAKGHEIINQLIHLTDPSQNTHFQDRYFGNIDIDLSHVTWVFSYNDAGRINHILRDRITEVSTSGFTTPDKLKIARQFLIPAVCSEIGMPPISIADDVVRHMIDSYTYEGGVRKIKELLFDVCRSLNVDDLCGRLHPTHKRRKLSATGTYAIPMEKVAEYLQHKRHMQKEKIHAMPAVGRINGLYASATIEIGGLISIETRMVPSDNVFGLALTGNLGKVMKESGTVAKTLAWESICHTLRSQWEARWKVVKESVHIHCPEGAVNKDGPSAGTALTVSIMSLLTNTPIRNDVAITGEINLSGDVLPIGGLRSKMYGAKSAGCTLVLFPADNLEDYTKICKECPELFDDTFRAISVSTLAEVLPHIFEYYYTPGESADTTATATATATAKTAAAAPSKKNTVATTTTKGATTRKYNTRQSMRI
jgi:endopeptidase La